MNGKTIKKKISKFPLFGDLILVTMRVPVSPLFGDVHMPPKPPKPEGWEDNLYTMGWRRTQPHPEGGFVTEIVEFGTDDTGIFGAKRTSRHDREEYLPEDWETSEIPEVLEIYKARVEWEKKYLSGKVTGIPLLDSLMLAGKFARAIFPRFEEEYLYITFPLICTPENKRKFSAEIHKAFRVAKTQSVRLTLLRGV